MKRIWESKDGPLLMSEMTESHLWAALRVFQAKVDLLEEELRSRGIRVPSRKATTKTRRRKNWETRTRFENLEIE